MPGGWGREGIYLTGSNCRISNNRFYNGFMGNPGSFALHINGNNNLIDKNIVEGSTLTTAGTHTGATGAAALTDSRKSWTTNDRVGLRLFNQTKQAYCTISANTSDTATCALSGGSTWSKGDYYTLGPTFYIVFHNEGNNTVFSNNIVRNVADVERVWDANGENVRVSGNEVSNMIYSGWDGVHPDIFQVLDSDRLTSKNWIIEKNYFHDLDSQIGINEMRAASTGGWIIRNNIFANITQRMMLNAKVYNNTFFQVQIGDQNLMDYATASDFELKNNIIIGGSTNARFGMLNRRNNGTDTTSISNNFYSLPMNKGYAARNSAVIAGYGDTGFINGGNPRFVAAYNNCLTSVCDFHLQASSPLIGKGMDLYVQWPGTTDYEGNARPQGWRIGWDIGAYQQGGFGRKPMPQPDKSTK